MASNIVDFFSEGDTPLKLHEVDVPILTNSACQAKYRSIVITSNMICAGLDVGGKDSCQVGYMNECTAFNSSVDPLFISDYNQQC